LCSGLVRHRREPTFSSIIVSLCPSSSKSWVFDKNAG